MIDTGYEFNISRNVRAVSIFLSISTAIAAASLFLGTGQMVWED